MLSFDLKKLMKEIETIGLKKKIPTSFNKKRTEKLQARVD